MDFGDAQSSFDSTTSKKVIIPLFTLHFAPQFRVVYDLGIILVVLWYGSPCWRLDVLNQ